MYDVLETLPEDLDGYTEESVKVLEDILVQIDVELDITEQEKVDSWVEALQEAIKGLKEKQEEKPPVEDEKEPSEDKPSEDKTTSPETGDNSMIMIYAGMIVVCMFILAAKKKKSINLIIRLCKNTNLEVGPLRTDFFFWKLFYKAE